MAAVAREAIAKGLNVPLFSQYAMQVFGCDGAGQNRLMPINRALRLAIERYGLWVEMAQREQEACQDLWGGNGFSLPRAA